MQPSLSTNFTNDLLLLLLYFYVVRLHISVQNFNILQHQSIRKIFIFVLWLHRVFYIWDRYLTYENHFFITILFSCLLYTFQSEVLLETETLLSKSVTLYKQLKLSAMNLNYKKNQFLKFALYRKCVKGCLNLCTPFGRILNIQRIEICRQITCYWIVTHEITSYHE